MNKLANKLGKNINKIRVKKGLSQGDISRASGMDRGYISNLENGRKNPTLYNIERIAKILDVEPFELLK